MSIHAYQWKPWDREKQDPPVQRDFRGPHVMDGRTRLALTPMCWVVVEDDGHIDVKPASWKPESERCEDA